MPASFFEKPILNSPYAYPARHWELDADGQPTDVIAETRRRSSLVTPVPKPKTRRKGKDQTNRGGGPCDGKHCSSTKWKARDSRSRFVVDNVTAE